MLVTDGQTDIGPQPNGASVAFRGQKLIRVQTLHRLVFSRIDFVKLNIHAM